MYIISPPPRFSSAPCTSSALLCMNAIAQLIITSAWMAEQLAAVKASLLLSSSTRCAVPSSRTAWEAVLICGQPMAVIRMPYGSHE